MCVCWPIKLTVVNFYSQIVRTWYFFQRNGFSYCMTKHIHFTGATTTEPTHTDSARTHKQRTTINIRGIPKVYPWYNLTKAYARTIADPTQIVAFAQVYASRLANKRLNECICSISLRTEKQNLHQWITDRRRPPSLIRGGKWAVWKAHVMPALEMSTSFYCIPCICTSTHYPTIWYLILSATPRKYLGSETYRRGGAARTGVGGSTLESKIKVMYDNARNPGGESGDDLRKWKLESKRNESEMDI